MKQVFLKAKREASIERFHPWVFSGAIASKSAGIADGEWVEVLDSKGKFLAAGHFHNGSICVRILSFQQTGNDQAFWTEKIRQAYRYRQDIGLTGHPRTNCFRLIHGEGDGLPGLIIDLYAGTAVVQCHSAGMYQDRPFIVKALQDVLGPQLSGIYDKSADTLPPELGATSKNGYLTGQAKGNQVLENGHIFQIDWEEGQKTGFFLDQRENRQLLSQYAAGKKVLNTYAYSGGFSIYALAAGAEQVTSVDVSAKALDLANQNVQLNQLDAGRHTSIAQDVPQFLRQASPDYDLLVVDPPAFAKSLEKRHNAVQAYKRLNALAMSKVRPGGILFTFSCSQVVDRQLFYNTIVAAAIEAGRQVRIMHQLSQPADHPVNIFHPEGAYLKGLALYVV